MVDYHFNFFVFFFALIFFLLIYLQRGVEFGLKGRVRLRCSKEPRTRRTQDLEHADNTGETNEALVSAEALKSFWTLETSFGTFSVHHGDFLTSKSSLQS